MPYQYWCIFKIFNLKRKIYVLAVLGGVGWVESNNYKFVGDDRSVGKNKHNPFNSVIYCK